MFIHTGHGIELAVENIILLLLFGNIGMKCLCHLTLYMCIQEVTTHDQYK